MRDPFRSNVKSQLIREAQIGLSVVAVLLSLFLYVAFYKISGRGKRLPDHVRNAPVAERVWPGSDNPPEVEMLPQRFLASKSTGLGQLKKPGNTIGFEPRSELGTLEPRESSATPPLEIPPDSPVINLDRLPTEQIASGGSHTQAVEISSAPTGDRGPAAKQAQTQTLNPITELKNLIGKYVRPARPVTTNSSVTRVPATSQTQIKIDSKTVRSEITDNALRPADNSFAANLTAKSVNQTSPEVRLASGESKENDFAPSGGFSPELKPNEGSNSESTIGAGQSAARSIASSANTATATSSLDLASGDWQDNSKHKFESIEPRPDLPSFDSETTQLVAPRPLTHIATGAKSVLAQPLPRPATNESGPNAVPVLSSVENPAEQNFTPLPSDQTRHLLSYIAREGDSFWSISQKVYQDGRFFRALYKYNEPTVPDPDALTAGTKIGTPTKEDLVKLWPDLCPVSYTAQTERVGESVSDAAGRIYVTRAGDTLWGIAQQKLGQASRYLEIHRMNDVRLDSQLESLSPLREGMRLVLPAQ